MSKEMSKECKLYEVVILNTYSNDASIDWIEDIEKMLNDTYGERVIKKYSLGSIIYAKMCEEKIEKIKQLYPNIVIEENVRYSIE
jgi:predicted alpha/beta hydrolase family esterase